MFLEVNIQQHNLCGLYWDVFITNLITPGDTYDSILLDNHIRISFEVIEVH